MDRDGSDAVVKTDGGKAMVSYPGVSMPIAVAITAASLIFSGFQWFSEDVRKNAQLDIERERQNLHLAESALSGSGGPIQREGMLLYLVKFGNSDMKDWATELKTKIKDEVEAEEAALAQYEATLAEVNRLMDELAEAEKAVPPEVALAVRRLADSPPPARDGGGAASSPTDPTTSTETPRRVDDTPEVQRLERTASALDLALKRQVLASRELEAARGVQTVDPKLFERSSTSVAPNHLSPNVIRRMRTAE